MSKAKFAFLLAPGAGAPSTHSRMKDLTEILQPFGPVEAFDYPYMLAGKKRPDPLAQLIAAHRAALEAVNLKGGKPVVLTGKSMGGRIGCHVALEEKVAGLICFGYPLCGAGDRTKLRDEVLIELKTPILFIQGTRDNLCPLDLLETVRRKMTARSRLHVVNGGDHSLMVSKTQLKSEGRTQHEVDLEIGEAVKAFLGSLPTVRH